MARKLVTICASVFYVPNFVYIYSFIISSNPRLNGLMRGRLIYTGAKTNKPISYVCFETSDLFVSPPEWFLDEKCKTVMFFGKLRINPDLSGKKLDYINNLLRYEYGARNVVRCDIAVDELLAEIVSPQKGECALYELVAQGLQELILSKIKRPSRYLIKFKKSRQRAFIY